MHWSKPRDSHSVYEALSAIADGRIVLVEENKAHCTSTSKDKYYEIEYDPSTNSIMSNDNMAYFVKEISYPIVAMLLVKGVIQYNKDVLEPLKNIKWKEINKKNKNVWMKSVAEVLDTLETQGFDKNWIEDEANQIYKKILSMELNQLGSRKFPAQTK